MTQSDGAPGPAGGGGGCRSGRGSQMPIRRLGDLDSESDLEGGGRRGRLSSPRLRLPPDSEDDDFSGRLSSVNLMSDVTPVRVTFEP